jgi:single-stranded-DNA-specific exonuclease
MVADRPVPTYNPADWPNIPEVIQRIYVSRGVATLTETEVALTKLLPPSLLGGIDNAAALLAQAIMNQRSIMIAGDYDCDGATGTSVAYRGLRMLGCEHLRFSIPNRFRHGYGVSPELVADMQPTPDLIVTVDSGTSSVDGVRAAKLRGVQVVITDHHLPPDVLPDADAIVNPNLVGDPFPSKMLAGVGVMFYVLMATCRHLRIANWFTTQRPEPSLITLLDLVAVGTVADLVPLDANNRLLVEVGLRRIRAGRCSPGLLALIQNARCDYRQLSSTDIAFNIAPRINAAGRLEDMRVGVLCLTCDDPLQAGHYAQELETINTARKDRQAEMLGEAQQMLVDTDVGSAFGVVVFNDAWHSGIVGLVASKLKESLHRPVVALAPGSEGSTELRGSCRSIPGFHLRDALALVDARHPGLMKKFGGHAMAAGLSLDQAGVEVFKTAFDAVAREWLTEDLLNATILTDGELQPEQLSVDFATYLAQWGPWGQAFPQPCFAGTFEVYDYRVLKDIHLKLTLIDPRSGVYVEAIYFSGYQGTPPPDRVRLAYELSINEFRDHRNLQLMVRHLAPG